MYSHAMVGADLFVARQKRVQKGAQELRDLALGYHVSRVCGKFACGASMICSRKKDPIGGCVCVCLGFEFAPTE